MHYVLMTIKLRRKEDKAMDAVNCPFLSHQTSFSKKVKMSVFQSIYASLKYYSVTKGQRSINWRFCPANSNRKLIIIDVFKHVEQGDN